MCCSNWRATILSLVAAALLLCGCSSDEQGDTRGAHDGATQYADWRTYTYHNIKIHYPPGHPQEDSLHKVAVSFYATATRDTAFFQIPMPDDTINIMYYTGYGHGREATGREYPFLQRDTIHFWLPSYYGPMVARYMIDRWAPGSTAFPFLKHGLMALLDFSGQNYHQSTMRRMEDDQFVPLPKLARDTTVNVNKERQETAEAASFVDFIVYAYGIEALHALYLAPPPFEQAVEGIFSVPVDSLETLWLNVAEQAAALGGSADTE